MERALIAAGSVPVLERPEEVAPLVTELIAGERLVVLERRGGWLRVVAPGHATGLDPRGYPGWARAGGLVDAPGWEPDLAVVAPNGAGLPLGARLRLEGEAARLPDGGVAALESGAAKPAGDPVEASPIGISGELLGLPYRVGRHRLDRRDGLLRAGLPRDGTARRGRAPRCKRSVRAGAVREPRKLREGRARRPDLLR